jgi:hypothetical protein
MAHAATVWRGVSEQLRRHSHSRLSRSRRTTLPPFFFCAFHLFYDCCGRRKTRLSLFPNDNKLHKRRSAHNNAPPSAFFEEQ